MNDRQVIEQLDSDRTQTYADFYANYKDGVREVAVGVRTRSDFRFLMVLATVLFGIVLVCLALWGLTVHFYSVLILFLLMATVAGYRFSNAKDCKE